jgi:hypothetical protein
MPAVEDEGRRDTISAFHKAKQSRSSTPTPTLTPRESKRTSKAQEAPARDSTTSSKDRSLITARTNRAEPGAIFRWNHTARLKSWRKGKQKHDSNGGPTTCTRHTLIKCMRPRCGTRSSRGSDRASMIIRVWSEKCTLGPSETPPRHPRASSHCASLLHFMPPMLNSAETFFASLSACVQAFRKYQLVFPPTYGILVHLTDGAAATGEATR